MRSAAAVLVFEDEVGLGKPRVDVAKPETRTEEGVGRPLRRTAEPLVGRHIRMDEAGVVALRLQGIEHRGYLLVLHDDQSCGSLRCFLVVSGYDCHLLARKADNVLRQQRHIANLTPLQPAYDISPAKHGVNTGERLRPGDVDAPDAGSGVGAAQRLCPQRTRWTYVECVHRAARRLIRPFRSPRRVADDSEACHA